MPDNTPIKSDNTFSDVVPYDFESYGVFVRIESNQQEMVDEAEKVLKVSLLNNVRPVRRKKFDLVFRLDRDKRGRRAIIQNGERIAGGGTHKKFFKFWESILRVAIAERAVGLVFLHAGVVGWKGKAIMIPADSFKVSLRGFRNCQNGAGTSDEFAIIDETGSHSFARRIGRLTETINRTS